MGRNKRNNKETPQNKTSNLFHIISHDVSWWTKKILETVNFKPDTENIVQLHQNEPKKETTELWEGNDIIDKNAKYLNENNFRFQIGKMQEDGWTIYSNNMLRICIEYMINHTKKWEHSIIQIRSDVWNLLKQWNERLVLKPEDQKKQIEKFVKENFGRKWKRIKVIIWSEQCPEVFEALQQWKRWIIPQKEPSLKELEKYLSETKKEKLSPLPIIQYLAYHANKDPELMALFYNTKPPAYIKADYNNDKKYAPWSSDADYYWIVEVWLRLTEILKWISIQWWAWRQRVYDKIISLILYWEDIISKNGDFKYYLQFDESLKSNVKSKDSKKIEESTESKDSNSSKKYGPIKSRALYELHKMIQNIKSNKENSINTDFRQLYVELNRKWLESIDEKVKKKNKLITNIAIWSLVSLSLCLCWKTIHTKINKQKERDNVNTEWLKYNERSTARSTYPSSDSLHKLALENPYKALHLINYPDPENPDNKADNKAANYMYEQEQILMSAYDLSRFNYINHGLVDDWLMKNKILDEYQKISRGNYRAYKKPISAKAFMDNYIEVLAGDYSIKHEEPYKHWWKYIQYIENTLKYWDKIDILKYKVEEKEERWYFNEENHQPYKVKFVKVYLENDQTIDLILAAKNYQYPEEFTLQNWLLCMKDLVSRYWKNIWISNIE